MNKIRNPRQGVVQKYFDFLIELRARLHKNPKYSVNDLVTRHRVGNNIIPALKDLNIISGNGRKGRQWIGGFPDYPMIYDIRVQIKKNHESKLKPFKKFKPSDLVHPVSGKQMGVGNVHHPKAKSILRSWTLIKSLTIFKYKLRIYKLK